MIVPPILVLRHGETEWNREGRMQGVLDSPLTERGIEQAQRQNAILRAFGVSDWNWYASPQGRAAHTAQIALEGNGTGLTSDARLREISLGDWTGLTRTELSERNPVLFETDGLAWYDHAPNGEGLAALADRTRAFLEELQGPSVIVTHGITSRVLRCWALGLPYEAFEDLEGGQGVAYHVENQVSRRLD